MNQLFIHLAFLYGDDDASRLYERVQKLMDGYRALGGPKEWLLITRGNGAKGEYGHMDLVIGERASTEVWPRVLKFFDKAPAPAPAPQLPQ